MKEKHRGLIMEEPLIFEYKETSQTGTDWPETPLENQTFLGTMARCTPLELPGLSEPEVVRHYTRLSQKNYGIDTGFFPLGSCTMKHNPRLNEKMAAAFAQTHPFQHTSTTQPMLQVMFELGAWLKELTGLPHVNLSPAAGAHGELYGMMLIKRAVQPHQTMVLVPESAHGTNPATARMCGFHVQTVSCDENGRVDIHDFKKKLNEKTACLMLTNPNTCGLFEYDSLKMSQYLKDVGAYFYCDGANFNAFIGKVRPADFGVDCMHLNLHKTFSTPHGGGGPGSGPVLFSEALKPYAPGPFVCKRENAFTVEENGERVKSYYGQFGTFVRALCYLKSHGKDGLLKVCEDAVLNANYLLHHLKDVASAPFQGTCMHEVLFNDTFLQGVQTLDFAKALIDEGYHPMTIYFPLIVRGAMLIEPTECESKETLDQFIETFRSLVEKIPDKDFFARAPQHAPRKRFDEVKAARQLNIKYP